MVLKDTLKKQIKKENNKKNLKKQESIKREGNITIQVIFVNSK